MYINRYVLYLFHCLLGIVNLINPTLWAPDGHIAVILVSILPEEGGGGWQVVVVVVETYGRTHISILHA